MASRQPHSLTIGDGRALASHASGVPLDDLEGFVLVVLRTDGSYRMIHDAGCLAIVAARLLDSVQMITDGLDNCQAGDHPH